MEILKKIGRFLRNRIVLATAAGACLVFAVWGGMSLTARKSAVSDADRQMARSAEILEQVLSDEEDGGGIVPKVETEDGMVSLKDADVKYAAGLEAHLSDPYMRKRIDMEKLRGIVEADDLYGWLTVPGTEIDYVVMKGTEEEPEKYLWKDMDGNASKTGCLFVQGKLTEDRDDHTVIYGHRLKDHSLFFGPLLQYRGEDFAQEHNTAYTYDDLKVTKWQLAYVCESKEDDPVYFFPYEKGTVQWEDLDGYLAGICSYRDGGVGPEDDMLVLSTCSGRSAGRPERLFLVYRDVAYYLY